MFYVRGFIVSLGLFSNVIEANMKGCLSFVLFYANTMLYMQFPWR